MLTLGLLQVLGSVRLDSLSSRVLPIGTELAIKPSVHFMLYVSV